MSGRGYYATRPGSDVLGRLSQDEAVLMCPVGDASMSYTKAANTPAGGSGEIRTLPPPTRRGPATAAQQGKRGTAALAQGIGCDKRQPRIPY